MKKYQDDIKNIEHAITYCLNSIVRKKANESLDILETAISKLTPVKPIGKYGDECPNCGEQVKQDWHLKNCGGCGQALDWSE